MAEIQAKTLPRAFPTLMRTTKAALGFISQEAHLWEAMVTA